MAGSAREVVTKHPFRHRKVMTSFHPGEILVQTRLDVRDDAERGGAS